MNNGDRQTSQHSAGAPAQLPSSVLEAIPFQPLASFTPVLDTINLFPQFPLATDLELAYTPPAGYDSPSTLSPTMLATLQGMLTAADTSYVQFNPRAFDIPNRRVATAVPVAASDLQMHSTLAQAVLNMSMSVQHPTFAHPPSTPVPAGHAPASVSEGGSSRNPAPTPVHLIPSPAPQPPGTPHSRSRASLSGTQTPITSRKRPSAVEIIVHRRTPLPSPAGSPAKRQPSAIADEADPLLSTPTKKRKVAAPPMGPDEAAPIEDNAPAVRERFTKRCVEYVEEILSDDDRLGADDSDSPPMSVHFEDGRILNGDTLRRLMRLIDRAKKDGLLAEIGKQVGRPGVVRLIHILVRQVKDGELLSLTQLDDMTHNVSPGLGPGEAIPAYGIQERCIASLDSCSTALTLSFMCRNVEMDSTTADIGAAEDDPTDIAVGEDFYMSSLATLRNVANNIHAVIEVVAKEGDDVSEDERRLQESYLANAFKSRLSTITGKVAHCLDELTRLLYATSLMDDVVIPMSYLGLSSLWTEASSYAYSVGIEKLQLAGVSLSRTIFALYPKLRSFVMEEVCGNLIRTAGTLSSTGKVRTKKGYRLLDGSVISMTSALLLGLVQACYGPNEIRKLAKDVVHEHQKAAISMDEQHKGDPETVSPSERKRIKKRKKDKEPAVDDTKSAANASPSHPPYEAIHKFTQHCCQSMDAASQYTHFLLKFLLSRCLPNTAVSAVEVKTRKKKDKAHNEAEYKAILEVLVNDLLTVVETPEWPGAEVILGVFAKLMINALDDEKVEKEESGAPQKTDAATKGLAVEYLGLLGARLRREPNIPVWLRERLGGLTSSNGVTALWAVEKTICEWLAVAKQGDSSLEEAEGFWIASWIGNMSSPVKLEDEQKDTAEIRQLFVEYAHQVLHDATGPLRTTPSIPLSQDASADQLAPLDSRHVIVALLSLLSHPEDKQSVFPRSVQHVSPFATLRAVLIHRLATTLTSDSVLLRSKTLKALQTISLSDPELFTSESVRRGVEARLRDASAGVRDVAVEVVGKLLNRSSDGRSGSILLTEEGRSYVGMLFERVLDVGTNVRKRVVRLLRDVWTQTLHPGGEMNSGDVTSVELTNEAMDLLAQIGLKVFGRLGDEEEGVRDVALKCAGDMVFGGIQSSHLGDSRTTEAAEHLWAGLAAPVRAQILKRTRLLVHLIRSPTGPALFENFLKEMIDPETKHRREYELEPVCHVLVQCLLEEVLLLEERTDREAVRDVLALLSVFATVFPEMLSSHVKTLAPYLKTNIALGKAGTGAADKRESDGTQIELSILRSVLTILHHAIPTLRNPDLQLLATIESDLAGLLNNVRMSLGLVPQAVECLVSCVKTTENWRKLTKCLRASLEFIRKPMKVLQSGGEGKGNSIVPDQVWLLTWRCLHIAARLVRYFDFDRARGTLGDLSEGDISAIVGPGMNDHDAKNEENSPRTILDSVTSLFLFFLGPNCQHNGTRLTTLTCLGQLFIGHPRLMLREDTREIMKQALDGSLVIQQSMLNTFAEYLRGTQTQPVADASSKPTGVDLSVLVGTAEELGDAGISSSVMQTYLPYILKCLLSAEPALTGLAFDVVEIILQQGLVHPILCVPGVVAMQACPMGEIRHRAAGVYTSLAEKHGSFIHGRSMDGVKECWMYVKRLSQKNGNGVGRVQGWNETTLRSADAVHTVCEPVLGKMYSVIQSKRQRRNEFLGGMVKMMDVDLKSDVSSANGRVRTVDIEFHRFLAENLALLEYKTQEEVLCVLFHALRVLSVTAETVRRHIERSLDSNGQSETTGAPDKADESNLPLPFITQASLSMSLLLLLKAHLQATYNLSSARVMAYKPNEGARSTERPLQRAHVTPPSELWTRMPVLEKDLSSVAIVGWSEPEMRDTCKVFVDLIGDGYGGHSGGQHEDDHDYVQMSIHDEPGERGVEHTVPVDNMVSPTKTPKASSGRRKSAAGRKRSSMVATTPQKKRKRKKAVGSDSEVDDEEVDPNWT
ncbi:sister chromatid cohesion C-terminus-domain-containing protein [Gaertneriomyces semiglobifer]|nr:sister chromatid cohesion C-terminus-domain-containing protein [Gaertneriomyces semiglobifer]